MRLKHLSLTNFRSYARLESEIPDGILLLKGGNAVGKTSILESLFYCATFSTTLAQQDRHLIRFEAESEDPAVARIVVVYDVEGKERKLEIRLILEGAADVRRFRKEILADGRKTNAQSAIGQFPAVLFLPHMTEIIDGAPGERRRYLNILLSQSIPGYARALSQYSRAVLQRNALLRTLGERGGDPGQLAYWDELLAAHGAFLTVHRAQAIQTLASLAQSALLRLTDGREILSMRYVPALRTFDETFFQDSASSGAAKEAERIAAISSLIRTNLEADRALDIRRGVSTVGPHRDEMRVMTNAVDVGTYGSRGQVRTTLLALKFAEVDWLKDKTGTIPLLLLDETFSELDASRRRELMRLLNGGGQAIVTTTDLINFSADFLGRQTVWEIRGGIMDKNPERVPMDSNSAAGDALT